MNSPKPVQKPQEKRRDVKELLAGVENSNNQSALDVIAKHAKAYLSEAEQKEIQAASAKRAASFKKG